MLIKLDKKIWCWRKELEFKSSNCNLWKWK